MPLSPAEIRLAKQRAVAIRNARHDPRDMTRAARDAFFQKFLDQTPTDLPAEERQRRAEQLRKAYYLGLSAKAAKARRLQREAA